MEKVRSG